MFTEEIHKLTRSPKRAPSELQGLKLRNIFNPGSIFFLLFFITFFSMMLLSVSKMQQHLVLSENGIHTQATILKSEPTKKNQACIELHYQFTLDNGLTYTGSGTVSDQSIRCEFKVGEEIIVAYLPENPATNDIVTNHRKDQLPLEMFLIIPFFFIILFMPTLFPDLKKILKHRKLYKTGNWTKGKLIYITDSKGSLFPGFDSVSSTLFITFQTADGTTIEAKQSLQNRWLLNSLQPDQTLNIIYQPSKPSNALVVECYIR